MTTKTPTKHFVIAGPNDMTAFETQENAVDQAKRYVGDRNRSGNRGYDTYNIYQLIAVVTSPVPEAIVTTL